MSALAAGCHILPPLLPNTVKDMGGPRYHPSNIYRRGPLLPAQVRRVALLPVVTTESTGFLKDGTRTLSPQVYPELEKCKRFELIPVSPEDLRQWTGKTGWRTDEPLPPDFFARLADATGCDAVLFCELTRYAPYPPIAVGWKFCLVANPPGDRAATPGAQNQIIWAADEVLDAGDLGIANAARDYYSQHLLNEEPSADAAMILNSPVMFGRYTLAALFDTLPARTMPNAKVVQKSSR
jgi:hypothetical protein